MRIDDCFELGYIVKTHGLAGQVNIQLDVDDPLPYYEMDSVFLEQSGKLAPFFFESITPQGDRLIAKFEEIDDAASASQLIGSKLYLPLDLLPELASDDYYYHELIGMHVVHHGQVLGKIETIYQPSAQFLAAVMYQGHEILIPIEDEIFLSVDKRSQIVTVELPEGFLEIYTAE